MSGSSPFVVVVAGTAEKLGKSTIASNLAVYLKALHEDLPVALLPCDRQVDLEPMFALGDGAAGTLTDLLGGLPLDQLLACGQFGVDYLASVGQLPEELEPAGLRKRLATSGREGILLIDAGSDLQGAGRCGLWAADLLLLPVQDPASLSQLAPLRRELLAGGGRGEMLWLLPSQLGGQVTLQQQVELLEFLQFAASERDCQLLELQLAEDPRVHRQAAGLARPILTRLPESLVHRQLKQLAEFVLERFRQGPDADCRRWRLLADELLPPRAKRVELVCPLCGRLALGRWVHYLEGLPARRRLLLHADCLEPLLEGTSLHPFLPLAGELLAETGVEGGGLQSELRLLLCAADGTTLERQQLLPQSDSGWEPLLRAATGRCLQEQQPGALLISPAAAAGSLLEPAWYPDFARRRSRLLARLVRGEGD